MIPINDIPKDFPDISMAHLTNEKLEDLRDISLADAIKEGRRIVEIASNKARKAVANAAAAVGTTSAPGTGASSPPAAIVDPAVHDAPCHSQTWNGDLNDNNSKGMNVRRRLHDDDDPAVEIDKLTFPFDGPRFFGKAPVRDIADILSASNLSTHMTKI